MGIREAIKRIEDEREEKQRAIVWGMSILNLEKMRTMLQSGVHMIELPSNRRCRDYLRSLLDDLDSFVEKGGLKE